MKMRKFFGSANCVFLIFILSAGFLTACNPGMLQSSSPAPSPAINNSDPAVSLSDAEFATLNSLSKVDDYPLYTMRYYGAYKPSASSSDDKRSAATRSPKSALKPSSPQWACSLFTAVSNIDSMLYGRNFDWHYSPAVLLFTNPQDGYASVSMVDIAYLGFGKGEAAEISELPIIERRRLLDAPFIPFDGMNEHGLVVGMAAVPPGHMRFDPNKETIGSVMVIRKILDHARNTDEALAIFQNYNITMQGGPPLHYLIADSSRRSMLVEFYQGEMVVIPNEKPWHIATNFLCAAHVKSAAGKCWRYDAINKELTTFGGQLTTPKAMAILNKVSQASTQWSIVYDISTGQVTVAMGRQYDHLNTFRLSLTGG